MSGFVYHFHPARVTERALDPLVTLGLGVASATLFACLCTTGALLMIYYVPTVEGAYGSMLDIQHAVTFGPFVRALHRWAAHGMVVAVALHLVRVFAHGAYRGRELNWFVGLALLLMTLGLAFTGYLLPWDQRSFWAVTVTANMADHLPWLGPWLKELFLGGRQVGQSTLLRFYMLHVALLPTGLLLLLALHFWRIRKDGGLAVEPSAEMTPPGVPAWPHQVLREGILILAVLSAFSLAAVLISAPLGAPPDLHHPSNPEKAPWYFLWVQEMVSYSAPVGGAIYPLVTVFFFALIPFVDREDAGVGRWFGTRPARLAAGGSLVLALAGFVLFEWLYIGAGAPVDRLAADLLNPASGMIALSLLAFLLAVRLARSTRAACMAALVVLLVGTLGFVAVGLCRGPDWVFYWPWEVFRFAA